MSVSKMEKLTVLALKKDTDALMRRLMRLHAVSVEDNTGELASLGLTRYAEDDVQATAARVARIAQVLPALTKRSCRRKALFAGNVQVSHTEFSESGRRARAEKTVEETERLLARAAEIRVEDAALEAECQALTPYLELVYPLDFPGTETTVHLLGSLPPSVTAALLESKTVGLGFEAEVLCADLSGVYISALCHRSDEEKALRALSELGFLRASFRETDGTPKELFDRMAAERTRLAREAERGEAQLCVLAENLTDVEILSDVEETTLRTQRYKQSLASTGECTVFSMWCPVAARERVLSVLGRFSVAYELEEPEEGEDVPVLLHNGPISRNFEWVLGMYSYPRYGKFDPTLIMSIFYFIIFGLMFADAGYGLVLTLACFGIVRWCHPGEGMKRFLLMFGYCGISCIICGVLFGSYFGNFPLAFMENVLGIPVNELPNLALLPTTEANLALLFDPLQNPMAFLVVSLGIGAVHLIAGMAVKAVLLCREGKPLEALFDICTYWLFFAGVGVIFLHRTVGLILLGAGAAAIVATQGRDRKGVMKLFGGLLGLYDLVGYASDLLSYSRILALGLAAGVIGQVVNILATMKGASFLGFLMLVLVFCIGHIMNLVINVLGTFVHTSRLQYIEFFGKFYEDGGTPFVPATPAERYTEDISTDAEPQGSQ